MRRPLLATDVVRFVGEPVAVVVAEDRYVAVDAADLVVVDYEPLTPVVDPESAATDTVVARSPRLGTNSALRLASPQRADFSGCEVVVELRVVNQRMTAAPIEPRSGVGLLDRGRPVGALLGLPGRAPGARRPRRDLRPAAGRDPGRGPGRRRRLRRQVPLPRPRSCCSDGCRRRSAVPVRWTETRTENMVGHAPRSRPAAARHDRRHPRRSHHRLPARRRCRTPAPTRSWARSCPCMTQRMLTRRLRRRQRRASRRCRSVTTTTPTTAYRGAGRPEAAAGHRAGRSTSSRPRSAWTRPRCAGATCVPTLPEATRPASARLRRGRLRRGAATGSSSRRLRRAARRAGRPPGRRATRCRWASACRPTSRSRRRWHPRSTARSSCSTDGRMRVTTGATPYGQGHETTWAMIVADRLGVAMDDVEIVHGDTDLVPVGGLTGRLALGAAGRRRGGRRVAEADRRGPSARWPSCSRPPSTTSCSTTRAGASTWPARRPVGRTGPTLAATRPPAPRPACRTSSRVVADVPVRRPRRRGRGRHRDREGRPAPPRRRRRRRARCSTRCWPTARSTAGSHRASPRR